MEKPERANKNEIDFILTSDSGTVQYAEVVNKAKINHRGSRAKKFSLKNGRIKLLVQKEANIDVVRAKTEEIRIALKNKYDALGEK